LSNFRRWCIAEFGSVRSAFAVFDSDCSGSLSFQEFRAACRVYGYDGSPRSLFSALDVDQQGTLALKEVVFLDDWEIDAEDEFEDGHRTGLAAASKAGQQAGARSAISKLTDDPAARSVRARRVARRKYELRQQAVPEIPRLRLSRKGDGEYSWSFTDPWQSGSVSARAGMPSQDRSLSVRTVRTSRLGQDEANRPDMSQDLVLSEPSSSFLGPTPVDELAVASLVHTVGLPSTSRSSPEGVSPRWLSPEPPRPRTQPNPVVPRMLSRLDDLLGAVVAKPSLDELLSNPRVGPPLKAPRKVPVSRIGSSYSKSVAYYA